MLMGMTYLVSKFLNSLFLIETQSILLSSFTDSGSEPESYILWNGYIFEILKKCYLVSSSSSVLPGIMLSHSCNFCFWPSLSVLVIDPFPQLPFLPSELFSFSMHFSICLNICIYFSLTHIKNSIKYLSFLYLSCSDKYCLGEKSQNGQLNMYYQ